MDLRRISDGDRKQQLRATRTRQGLGSGLIQSIIAVILFWGGGFRLSGSGFLALMTSLWMGNAVFYLLIRSGFNRRFSDPSLTQPQLVWGSLCTLALIYFMVRFRFLMLPFLLLVLMFGSFKLTARQYLVIAVSLVTGYAAVMGLIVVRHPETIQPRDELMGGAAFILTILGFSLVGNDISRLRSRLRQRNADLRDTMQRIEQMARTDELTGLINRREMMFLLERQKARSDRRKTCFSLCFFDIDHFKAINDTFGHHIGDMVLKRFAVQTMTVIREADLFARFGGEEFLLLATDSDMEATALVAERVRRMALDMDLSDISADLSMTVSAGIAQFRPGEKIRSILTRSDKALYLAKNSGRNCIRREDEVIPVQQGQGLDF